MERKHILFMIAVLGLGITAVGTKLPKKIHTDIAVEQNEFIINDKGVLISYLGTEKTVIIPEEVTSIKEEAFDCNNLKSVIIPASVDTIETRAFFWCSSLEEIIVEEGNQKYESRDGVLFEKTTSGLRLIKYPDNKKEDTYIIPKEVTEITEWSFEKCSGLDSVTIPDGVAKIKAGAFDSSSLIEIIIADTVKDIEKRAFGYCEKLTSIVIPDNITIIKEQTFVSCKSLINVTLSKKLKTIEEQAFFDCQSLKNIMIPDNVETIKESAFQSCSSLENIKLPKNLKAIEEETFSGCESLMDITIPENVTTLGYAAFMECAFKDITIPNSITSIEPWCFFGCSNLTNITISSNVTNIGELVFYECSALENITVEKENKKYEDNGGVLFEKRAKGLTLLLYPARKTDSAYIIPKDVIKIAVNAFKDCKYLKKITIPDNIKEIGNLAFFNCKNLTSLTLPHNIKIIYSLGSFWNCNNLKNININVKKGEKISVKVILDDGSDMKKPKITSKNKKIITVSKQVYNTNKIGETSADVTLKTKKKGKTKVVFQRISRKHKKIKATLTIIVK